ncbi:hypothetical protein Tsp_04752 [Trichinella spiralis]|uniref:hypothetical protein n=1 Tax=Trichinella spiralis TaxID=6334 RepID=UPI0001EFDBEF|nr:hypothetical protein Tsp_04752 [Trichinella spiralis]
MEPTARHQLLQLGSQRPCLINTSAAARGVEAQWHCAHTLTVLMAKKEKSTGVPVLFADLDLYIHLLNVRLQPYLLTRGEPPTGRSRCWDMLSAGGSTKLLRSALSRRIQHSTFVLLYSRYISLQRLLDRAELIYIGHCMNK